MRFWRGAVKCRLLLQNGSPTGMKPKGPHEHAAGHPGPIKIFFEGVTDGNTLFLFARNDWGHGGKSLPINQRAISGTADTFTNGDAFVGISEKQKMAPEQISAQRNAKGGKACQKSWFRILHASS
jgi:hypothetical protein